MDRADHLCARYFDGLATSGEIDELVRLLRSRPECARAFRESYQLDQMLGILHTPAHVEAIEAVVTQLRREADPFVENVARAIPAHASPNTPTLPRPPERSQRPARAPASCCPGARRSGRGIEARGARFGSRPARWSRPLAFAVSGALMLGLSAWFFGPPMGGPVLMEVNGAGANIERGPSLLAARAGMPLEQGDVLRTASNGTARLAFGAERTRLDLAADSELRIVAFATAKRFELLTGRLANIVARQRPFRPMILRTPHAEARVVGTEFTLAVNAQASLLDVTEGAVQLTRTSDGQSVLVRAGQTSRASAGVELSALPRPRGLLREYWTNVVGDHLSQLERHRATHPRPDGSEILTNLLVRPNWGDHFGDILRGYVHPPVTGKYTFWISGDPNATLNLSRDEKPGNCVQIAITAGGGPGDSPQDWDLQAVQRSSPLTLVAGRRYYIEVIRKTDQGLDHLAVAWQPPGGDREIIRGEFLSPTEPGH